MQSPKWIFSYMYVHNLRYSCATNSFAKQMAFSKDTSEYAESLIHTYSKCSLGSTDLKCIAVIVLMHFRCHNIWNQRFAHTRLWPCLQHSLPAAQNYSCLHHRAGLNKTRVKRQCRWSLLCYNCSFGSINVTVVLGDNDPEIPKNHSKVLETHLRKVPYCPGQTPMDACSSNTKIEGGQLHEGGAWMIQLSMSKRPPHMQSYVAAKE